MAPSKYYDFNNVNSLCPRDFDEEIGKLQGKNNSENGVHGEGKSFFFFLSFFFSFFLFCFVRVSLAFLCFVLFLFCLLFFKFLILLF